MFINREKDEEDVEHTHTHTHTLEYNSAIKKKEILPFAAIWMEGKLLSALEGIMLSDISQIKKDKDCMMLLTCEILKIQQTSEYNKRETDSLIQRTN